jgi:phosphatidate cytidylyltransferase
MSERTAALAKRVVSALLFLPFFFWLIEYAPAWLFPAFMVLVGALGQWEFTRMFGRAGSEVYPWLGLLAGVAVTASFAVPGAGPVALSLTVAAFLSASLIRTRDHGPVWEPCALTLLGVCYVNWLLGYALWLRALPYGAKWIFLLVWVTWVGESAAYFVGTAIGRHKLSPRVSPAKTVEGALAQLLVSLPAALAGRWWFFPECSVRDALIVGLFLGCVGQVGDLVESFLKRSTGTKDTGGLIPGHGGLLDRLDSLLFNAPALFYYARYLAT